MMVSGKQRGNVWEVLGVFIGGCSFCFRYYRKGGR